MPSAVDLYFKSRKTRALQPLLCYFGEIYNFPFLLFPTDFDFLLVIGGYDGTTQLAEAELVTLDPDNNPVPPCLDSLQDFPVGLYAAAGAVDEAGNPFICGGIFLNPSGREQYDQCYKYDPQRDSWEQHGTMPYKKGFIADTEVPGLGLVMVGGEGDGVGNEVIATTDGMTFQELGRLPGPTYGGETIQKHLTINFTAYFHG